MISRFKGVLPTLNATNFSETLSGKDFPALHGGW